MVGQPPLERHIGVRIPGGQPNTENKESNRVQVNPDNSRQSSVNYRKCTPHGPDDDVADAYNYAKYLEPRRKMMQDWADFLDLKLAEQKLQVQQAQVDTSIR